MKRDPKPAKLVVLESDDPIFAETERIQSRIRQRAFERSLIRPNDAHELYDWMTAESEVISVPPAELIERDGAFEVRFAVAGVNPDDVNLMLAPKQILLKSDFRHEHSADHGKVHLCDFKSATVFRSVNLPEPIDVKTAQADFDDGIIRVTARKQAAEALDSVRRKKAVTSERKVAAAKKGRAKLP
jgi:HSP20 family molecular chaperone IbpA